MLSESQLLNFPYMSTEFDTQAGTRGTAFSWEAFTLKNDQVQINGKDVLPVFIDYADLAQIGSMANWIKLGERMGQVVNDRVGELTLDSTRHALWTDFGQETLDSGASGTTAITVSATNIDDIVRGIEREVEEANGFQMIQEKGLFIEWRPRDKEYLAQYCQANGFQLADKALKDGLVNGYYVLGFTHYVSNRHAAAAAGVQHLFGGVRKVMQLGLLGSTWGRMYRNEGAVPEASGPVSGVGQHMRIDHGFNVPTAHAALVHDINVVG